MIYTITLNPAIDYSQRLESFSLGSTNRSSSERYFAGGKGINVSTILARLGITSTATGFVGGFVGDFIVQAVKNENIIADFVSLESSISRINIKLIGIEETEINGSGPLISDSDINALIKKLRSLTQEDIVVLSGNAPKSLNSYNFIRLLEVITSKTSRFILDISGKLLLDGLKFTPFLVKPNLSELSEASGMYNLVTDESRILACKKMVSLGARNVLLSLGKEGALFYDTVGRVHRVEGIPGDLVSSVGSGDSLLAGFIYGLSKYDDIDTALKLGNCCGAATAFSNGLASSMTIANVIASSK